MLEQLIQLPVGRLGGSYTELIRRLNYDPDFFRPCPIDSDAQWLTQRVATTHDIHHMVAHGMAIGHQAHCLMAHRWEEGLWPLQPNH